MNERTAGVAIGGVSGPERMGVPAQRGQKTHAARLLSDAETEAFEACRTLLFGIAYRMLGSVMEAEDVVQDAYVRYGTAEPDQIRSPRAFLSTVVTRLCLDRLKSARVQRERYIGTWLPEPVLTDDHGWQTPGARLDLDESVSLALLVLLETLTPVERAVFLLREVFDFGYDEIAAMVGRRTDACRQLFVRAKQHIAERRPRFTSTPEDRQRLTTEFLQAVTAGDMNGLTNLLAEDIGVWADGGGRGAAARRPLFGRQAVARFLIGVSRRQRDFTVEIVEVNGSPGCVVWQNGQPMTVLALEVDGQQIREIRAIGNPDKLQHLRRPAGE